MTTSAQETQSGWIPSPDTFGSRLVLIRSHLQLNIKDAAARAELDDDSWRMWERGRLPRDVVTIAKKIADGLGCDYLWLLTGTEPGKHTYEYLPDSVIFPSLHRPHAVADLCPAA